MKTKRRRSERTIVRAIRYGLLQSRCGAVDNIMSIVEGTKRLVLKELPDLETEDEVINTWTVENWRGLPRRTHGPVFMAGGHPWYVAR